MAGQRISSKPTNGWRHTALGESSAYLDSLYASYLRDPSEVPTDWRVYFDDLPGTRISRDRSRADSTRLREQHEASASPAAPAADSIPCAETLSYERQQVRVLQLIEAYRAQGHRVAKLDPLGRYPQESPEELTLAYHDLAAVDPDQLFDTGSLAGPEQARFKDILARLQATYCGTIGSEYMYLPDSEQRRWLQQRIEAAAGAPTFAATERRRILEKLTAAEGLERYLHTRYVGQKRFSLEGAESLLPMLDELVQRAGEQAVQEVVLGMAHRGRLNVLVNLLGRPTQDLFDEFEGTKRIGRGTGDVKYHRGFSADVYTGGGPVHVVLAFNPSHLEIVNPVVEGSVRARQERREDDEGRQVIPVLVHGDAAFAGQGVVMETFNMAHTRGFTTHGTVHVVVNNQIGFTTSTRDDARSTPYCTAVAKMVDAPIFHVNGDDPEAVVYVIRQALDYRMRFFKDVVVDMVCYRRFGHNEADEPAATQPRMYRRVRELEPVRGRYQARLEEAGVITARQAQTLSDSYRGKLERGETIIAEEVATDRPHARFMLDWTAYHGVNWDYPVDTAVSLTQVQTLSERLATLPEGFQLHKRVAKIVDSRQRMGQGEQAMDWGFAETMAYATLLDEGYGVRLCGQDTARGTFFHRHCVLHDQNDGRMHMPLNEIAHYPEQLTIIDSLLSEEAVLGFEYGYATAAPEHLVIWEAQFGDFANAAQVVIDQFICSGEQKWGRLCGLTLFLPHGYEGQGPEHSSARPERFLQLCAQHNIQVCVPTTPAQTFHMLRRQMLRPYRKPLIVMTPKSLLRHKHAINPLEDLSTGRFRPVLADLDSLEPAKVDRVLLCSGKVYYDLLAYRRQQQRRDVVILRIEQLYPFPEDDLSAALAHYPHARRYIWVQEESLNQGAWYSTQHHIRGVLPKTAYLEHVTRPASASTAVGYADLHAQEQRNLVEQAFA